MKLYFFYYKRKKGSRAVDPDIFFFELHRHPYYVLRSIERVKTIANNYKFMWYVEIGIFKFLFWIFPFWNNYKKLVKFK